MCYAFKDKYRERDIDTVLDHLIMFRILQNPVISCNGQIFAVTESLALA